MLLCHTFEWQRDTSACWQLLLSVLIGLKLNGKCHSGTSYNMADTSSELVLDSYLKRNSVVHNNNSSSKSIESASKINEDTSEEHSTEDDDYVSEEGKIL